MATKTSDEAPKAEPTQNVSSGGVACIHCQKKPGYIKISVSSGEVYWALECYCPQPKRTPYYRSTMFSASDWASKTFKMEYAEAKKIAEEYDKKYNPELKDAF